MSDFYLLLGVAFLLIGLFGLWATKYKPEKAVAVIVVAAGCYFLYMASCAKGIYCVPSAWTNAVKNIINLISHWR